MNQPDAVIVLTTWPVASAASLLADTLVGEHLAGCVNILPAMESVYVWQGRLEHEREHQVIIKTTRARLDALERRLVDLHPYEVPELLVLEASGGSTAYLSWLRQATETVPGPAQS